MIAIIGGSGVNGFPLEGEPQEITVRTPWGNAELRVGRLRGKAVVFLARHGAGHKVPPHRINYRANIAALKKVGVAAIFATTAVGSLREDLIPGELALLDDQIDFTRDRTGKTFFDGEGGTPVVHTDFTHPYSDELRITVLEAAAERGIPIRPNATYLCNDGPRYESAAEVRLFAQWGADVIGMTGVPEVQLAREAGIHYCGISLVTNLGAGIARHPLTHTEVEEAMAAAKPQLITLLVASIDGMEISQLPAIGPRTELPGLGV